MQKVNEYLATTPFDLYELFLFHLVVKHRSFTRAADAAGVTQSAITRQMQGLETSLGLELLERTTRSVRVSPAGEFLYHESLRLLGDVDALLHRLREEFAGARKQVRVGVSQTISLAYLPGFFHANRRRLPEIACRVSHLPSREILAALQANDLDLGVISRSTRLPPALVVTHRFQDTFCLIAPVENGAPPPGMQRPREFWEMGGDPELAADWRVVEHGTAIAPVAREEWLATLTGDGTR